MTGLRSVEGQGTPKRKPPKPQAASKAQHKRFVDAAREAGADQTGEEFEQAFRKIVPPKLPGKAKSRWQSKQRPGPELRRGGIEWDLLTRDREGRPESSWIARRAGKPIATSTTRRGLPRDGGTPTAKDWPEPPLRITFPVIADIVLGTGTITSPIISIRCLLGNQPGGLFPRIQKHLRQAGRRPTARPVSSLVIVASHTWVVRPPCSSVASATHFTAPEFRVPIEEIALELDGGEAGGAVRPFGRDPVGAQSVSASATMAGAQETQPFPATSSALVTGRRPATRPGAQCRDVDTQHVRQAGPRSTGSSFPVRYSVIRVHIASRLPSTPHPRRKTCHETNSIADRPPFAFVTAAHAIRSRHRRRISCAYRNGLDGFGRHGKRTHRLSGHRRHAGRASQGLGRHSCPRMTPRSRSRSDNVLRGHFQRGAGRRTGP